MKKSQDDELWLTAFGEAIAERRAFVAMTQQQLADGSGVHRTYISDVERGYRNITATTAMKIAGALETTAARLFIRADKMHAERRAKRAGQ